MGRMRCSLSVPTETTQRMKYGMSIKEIAEEMEETPQTVSRILFRALKKLRKSHEARRLFGEYFYI